MTSKNFFRSLSIVIALSLGASNVVPQPAMAAVNGIVKGPNMVDQEDTYQAKTATGDVKLSIKNSALTVTVGASVYKFKIGTIESCVDQVVLNETDELVHILTLSGAYYVFDIRSGVSIPAYRNSSNGKYCLARNTAAYAVMGQALINQQYFFEIVTGTVTSRELLMTRAEFDQIISGTDPSVEKEPEKEPEKQPEKEPEKEPEKQPEKEPEKQPEKEPEKEPQPSLPEKEPEQEKQETVTVTTQSSVTDTHTETETKWNFSEVWEAYLSGKITWEQFQVISSQFNWTTNTQATEESKTYYVYDDKGNLIEERTIKTSSGTESGTGKEQTTESTTGQAQTTVTVVVTGAGVGEADTVSDTHEETETVTHQWSETLTTPADNTTSQKESSSKKKTVKRWHVTRTAGRKRTKLLYGKTTKALLVLKKGVQLYNGKKMSKVAKNGFAVYKKAPVVIKKNGNVCIYNGRTWKKITVGAKKFLTDNRGLATKVVLKKKAVKIKTLARKSKVKFY